MLNAMEYEPLNDNHKFLLLGDYGTLNVWVKHEYNSGYQYLYDTSNSRYLSYTNGGENAYYYFSGTNVGSVTGSYIANVWTMSSIVWNSSAINKVVIYRNGVIISNKTGSFTGSTPTTFYLGTKNNGREGIYGLIDEFSFWNRPLNISEITQLYNNSAGLTCAEIIASGEGGVTPPVGTPSTNFTIWDGTMWLDSEEENAIYRCYTESTECEPDNQVVASSQSIHRICNNGTASGDVVYFYLGQTYSEINLSCDDDYTYAGATLITTTPQDIHGPLAQDVCIDISCWADYGVPTSGGLFDTYANVTVT